MATKNAGRGQSQSRSGGRGSGGSSGGSSAKSGNRGGSSRSQGTRGGSSGSASGGKSSSSRGGQSAQRGQSSQRSGKSQQGSQQRSQRGGGQQSSQQGTTSRAVGAVKGHPYISAAVGAGLAGLAALGVKMMRSRNQSEAGQPSSQRGEMDEEGEYEDSSQSGEEEGGDYEGEEDDDGGEEEYSEDDDEEDSTRASSEAPDQRRGGKQDEGPSMGDKVKSLGSSAWASLSRVGSRAADAVRNSAGSVGDAARTGYQQGQQAADDGIERHPLLICASALALGAAAGLLLPSTPVEDRLIGKRADKVTRRIRSAGSKLWEQSQHVFSEAGQAIASQAEREGLTPQRLGRKMKRIGTHVRDAITNALND